MSALDVVETQAETAISPAAGTGAEPEGTYRKRKLGFFFWASVVWLALLLFGAIFADLLPLKDPEATFRGVSRDGPGSEHWFGADNIGHDVFSRTIYGARRSLYIGAVATLLGGVIGVVVGLLSGFYRRTIDAGLMAVLNIVLAIPALVLLITLVQFLAPPDSSSPTKQTFWVTIALSLLVIPGIARVTRAQVMVWGDRDFVMASRTLGARNKRIIMREIFPNTIPTLVSFAFTILAVLIVAEAALALFAVGDVSGVSWGLMIQNGRSELERSPHMVLFPALFIFLTVLAINFIGDQVRTLFDVRERHLMAGSGTAHLREEAEDKVLQVEHLVVEFPSARGTVHAVSDVSLDLLDRETLGIVGESGCGKSTTGKAIMRVPPPTSGRVLLDGVDMSSLASDELRQARTRLQMIFQDAISSLNPRRTIREVVSEPLTIRWLESLPRSPVIRAWERYTPWMLSIWRRPIFRKLAVPILVAFFAGLMIWVIATALGDVGADGIRDGGPVGTAGIVLMIAALVVAAPLVLLFGATALVWLVLVILMPFAAIPRSIRIRRGRKAFKAETETKVRQVLEDVGIDPDAALDRRPHEFSGGQAQRISIARALILDPEVIICDEPVSALDVSVQAQVLNLLEDLKVKYGISLIFIAHDLAVVKNVSDRVVVMYLGKVCEVGPPDALFARSLHPYTEILMSSIPVTDPSVDPRAGMTISGELPSPVDPPSGCRFRTRCPRAQEVCAEEEPVLRPMGGSAFVACHFPVDHASPNGSHDEAPVAVGGS